MAELAHVAQRAAKPPRQCELDPVLSYERTNGETGTLK